MCQNFKSGKAFKLEPLRLYLPIRLDKILCLVFCYCDLTLVLIDLLLMTGDCWMETSNMLNYMVVIKIKVSENFRGGEDLDKAVTAADDDSWGRLDLDKEHSKIHGPKEDESY